MTKLLCLLFGHHWTQWHRARTTQPISWRCLCKRCGKVWRI
jgi:hypothetical protein